MSDQLELLSGEIPALRVGSSPNPLIILNGGQTFMRRSSLNRFQREARRIARLLPDGQSFILLGYGAPPDQGGLESLADRLARALETLPGSHCVVGISYGGPIVLRLAARHPRLVSRLILAASAHAYSAEGLARVRRQIELTSQERWSELLAEFGGVFRRPWFKWLLRLRLATRRRSLAAEMSEPDRIVAFLRAGLTADGADNTNWLRRMTVPTLILGGEHDQFFGEGLMARTAARMLDARLVLLPGETHMAPVERASVFRREIAVFLAGTQPSSQQPRSPVAVSRLEFRR